MKYKELIEKLLPYAEEEINIATVHYIEISVNTSRDEVKFFRGNAEEFITGIKQTYNLSSLENNGPAEEIK